jgi:HlyD family secretion protein
MIKITKQLFSLLTPNQRKRFYLLQFLVILMAFMEIIGVASIIPFMALVGDMTQLQQETFYAQVYQASGIESESEFVVILGIGVVVTLFVSGTISLFTTWRLCMFGTQLGTELSTRLYTHYIKQNWLFHASVNSAKLTKKIVNETNRVSGGIILPLMQMNARVVFTLFMVISIFIYDPRVAIVGLSVFAIVYLILFKIVKRSLERNGKAISQIFSKRYRLNNEGFGGIKDLLLLGRGDNFIESFNQTSKSLAHSQGTINALAQVPRYFIELVAFGSMMTITLYLISSYDGNLGMILPTLSLYTLAAFKLLPAIQNIYANVAAIKGNIAAFESIHDDLIWSSKPKALIQESKQSFLRVKHQISLNNITFTYPDKTKSTLQKINMSILANSVIGIVGPSGSGKSTLINILLGLIEPQQGEMKIDNTILNYKNRRSWQNTIGFVAQDIFLSDRSIAENVAFGISKNEINLDKVKKALELSHLTELLQSLEKGIYTPVGERGVKLSGGQSQRIGIARALYHEAEILVFDEATSSLDGISERRVMDAIHEFGGQKTIIMIAHRIKTVQNCNKIFYIDKGRVVDQGTYKELIERNDDFKNMAR